MLLFFHQGRTSQPGAWPSTSNGYEKHKVMFQARQDEGSPQTDSLPVPHGPPAALSITMHLPALHDHQKSISKRIEPDTAIFSCFVAILVFVALLLLVFNVLLLLVFIAKYYK